MGDEERTAIYAAAQYVTRYSDEVLAEADMEGDELSPVAGIKKRADTALDRALGPPPAGERAMPGRSLTCGRRASQVACGRERFRLHPRRGGPDDRRLPVAADETPHQTSEACCTAAMSAMATRCV
eukprot:365247-Chlamydomonas_euryale.AAC.12